MKKVLQKLFIQVWSSQVLWIDVEIFRNVLENLKIGFRPRSIWASIQLARRILTEFLLVTTIQGGKTNLWLPIIFSSLCWEILCPGKLWKWTDLEQGSTLFQVFDCVVIAVDYHIVWNFAKTGRQSLNKWWNTWCPFSYIETSYFQCCDYFVLKLTGMLYIWEYFLANRPHICLIVHKAEVAVGETVCEGFERSNWVVRSWCYSIGHSCRFGCLQVCVNWIFFKKPCENHFVHRQA